MNKEFSFLTENIPYQREFLEDWWTLRKGIVGGRAVGKTTTLLCELHRFNQAKIDTAWISRSQEQNEYAVATYTDLFGEPPIVDTHSWFVEDSFRGHEYDAVIIDSTEIFQEEEDMALQSLLATQPMYIRAAVDDNFEHDNFYEVCDKVYEVENSEIAWR